MTSARLARIRRLIAEADSNGELMGLVASFRARGELAHGPVAVAVSEKLKAEGWSYYEALPELQEGKSG